jgi:hypothetical protein
MMTLLVELTVDAVDDCAILCSKLGLHEICQKVKDALIGKEYILTTATSG